jgi:tetratricopeptide (TPR) repeat protein
MNPRLKTLLRLTVALAPLLCGAAGLASASAAPDSQQDYWAQFDRRDWDAAARAAEQLVAAARERAKEEPLRLAQTLVLLANAQLGKADYVNAERTYREALTLVERNAGHASAELLDPLRGLGYTLAGAGRHEEALPYLDRALLITHRAHGLFDISQQGLLRQLATTLTRLGQPEEAERHVNYLLRVAERAYGTQDPRFASTLSLVGSWHNEVGNFVPARLSYRNAVEILSKKLGDNDVALIEPLRGYAQTFTQELLYSTLWIRTFRPDAQPSLNADGTVEDFRPLNPRFLSIEGERALERAVAILDAKPDAPRELAIATLLQVGDWFQIKHQSEKALAYYKRVWTLSHAGAEPQDAQSEATLPLSFPVRLYYPTPQAAVRNLRVPDELVDARFVQVDFTVRADGAVTDANIAEHDASNRQAADTLEAVRVARYRPKFVAGEPAESPGMQHREVFRIRKEAPGGS